MTLKANSPNLLRILDLSKTFRDFQGDLHHLSRSLIVGTNRLLPGVSCRLKLFNVLFYGVVWKLRHFDWVLFRRLTPDLSGSLWCESGSLGTGCVDGLRAVRKVDFRWGGFCLAKENENEGTWVKRHILTGTEEGRDCDESNNKNYIRLSRSDYSKRPSLSFVRPKIWWRTPWEWKY